MRHFQTLSHEMQPVRAQAGLRLGPRDSQAVRRSKLCPSGALVEQTLNVHWIRAEPGHDGATTQNRPDKPGIGRPAFAAASGLFSGFWRKNAYPSQISGVWLQPDLDCSKRARSGDWAPTVKWFAGASCARVVLVAQIRSHLEY
jgi:hypothetical protein